MAHVLAARVLLMVVGLSSAGSVSAQDVSKLYARVKSAIVTVNTESASGTGFVIENGDYALTCAHVVKGATTLEIVGARTSGAEVLYLDPGRDIAILRLGRRFPYSLKISKGSPTPGTRVYVIGSALGVYDKTITDGLVSGIRHSGNAGLLQISAQITHGNSGSPVLSIGGEVVGMAQSTIPDTAIAFALSAHDIRMVVGVLKDLDSTGREILGRVAQTKDSTGIFFSDNPDSKLLYKCEPYEYIIVKQFRNAEWLKVVLKKKGVYGFVRRNAVRILPYQVTRRGITVSTLDGLRL